ncbi:hypothetical protein SmJEL517_g06160 [Synchytrium microbalum]|uniref:Uncharacterized protein n=1 Tax=Synchytrium microbalum TaxID=1806994 RepID=A0A507BY74_9FUNG|nr:uncharacterized protein SmJEL517_g06160 [Synchytrium microbalum]TPX30223.1 hypothetical protein SmJEL517_g06160 [Synchytrium microbalum]
MTIMKPFQLKSTLTTPKSKVQNWMSLLQQFNGVYYSLWTDNIVRMYQENGGRLQQSGMVEALHEASDLYVGSNSIWTCGTAPFLSLSVNSDQKIVAGGTEFAKTEEEDESHILFYDVRNASQTLKVFTDVHSDDITQVKFHPTQSNIMLSGSTDGLLCLYQLDEALDEDESLYQVIKEDSVHKAGFFGPSAEYIYLTTHMETFSIWNDEADVIVNYGQVKKISSPHLTVDYLIDVSYSPEDQRLYLFTGSQTGNVGIFNSSLEGLELMYTLNGGHNDIVRGVAWDSKNTIVSGGEDGNICSWTNT